VPCAARVRAERAALADLRGALPGRPVRLLPEAEAPVGVVGLRALGRRLLGRLSAAPAARAPASAGRAVHGGSAAPAARAPASAGRAVRVRRNAQPRAARARRAEAAPLASQLASRGLRLLVFGGKGGVGKTTCAVAAALALADMRPRRRVLLLSADPAHSLGDALDMAVGDQVVRVTDGSSRLWARELDADRAFRVRRDHYRTAVDDLFGSLLRGARVDAVYDRAVLHDLIDLAPPGLDELFALLTLGEALFAGAGRAPFDLVVLDTAPTGHTLRLLELPATALEWVHALLAILLKYREAVALGDLAADLLQTARGLKRLQALLRDPGGARFVVVTRAATLPRRETERLLVALGRLRMAVPAVVVDALTAGTCRRCRRAAAAEARELAALRGLRSRKRARWAMLLAPASFPPPRGVDALRRWSRTWEGASA
jgi:arsenite-transporting ATPase